MQGTAQHTQTWMIRGKMDVFSPREIINLSRNSQMDEEDWACTVYTISAAQQQLATMTTGWMMLPLL